MSKNPARPWTSYRFETETCIFCRRREPDLRTGWLPLDGPVWVCAHHRKEYYREKTFQSKCKVPTYLLSERIPF